ncbi:MAG: hypothetical protein PHT59_04075 [Candidatus Omnitrophica bacterium]|nr:hypothetical protein [Candidatus Omnitrophota bacterium]
MANLLVTIITAFMVSSHKIGEYKNKVDNLETTLGKDEHNGLRKTVGDLSVKVAVCDTLLSKRGPLGKNKSPLSLTERGMNFLKESGGEKFVDDNFDELAVKVEALKPATSYDVQEDSKSVIEALRDDSRLDPLKEFLFKDGSEIEDLFFVMGIHLRDKILARKNWNVNDIEDKG